MTDEKFDHMMREALVRKGWVLPTTIREVMIAEEELAKLPPIELPEALRDPWAVMRRHPEVFGEVKRRE